MANEERGTQFREEEERESSFVIETRGIAQRS